MNSMAKDADRTHSKLGEDASRSLEGRDQIAW